MLRAAIIAISKYITIRYIYPLDRCSAAYLADLFVIPLPEIEEFMSVCLSLIHTPQTLSGLLDVKAAMRVLVREILMRHNHNAGYIRFVDRVLCTWFKILDVSPFSRLFKQKVTITAFPSFNLYIAAAEFKNDATPLYGRTCMMICKAVSTVLTSPNVSVRTKDDYLRAIRVCFEFMPDEIKYNQALSDKQVIGQGLVVLIDKALERYRNHKDTRDLGNRAKTIRRKLVNILILNKVIESHPHDGPGRGGKGGKTTVTTNVISLTETPDVPGKVVPGGDAAEPDEVRSFEVTARRPGRSSGISPEVTDEQLRRTYAFDDTLPPAMDIVARPPKIRLRIYDAVSLRANLFFFDSRFAGIHHLSMLLIVIQDAWESCLRKEKLIMVFHMFLMMTGTAPDEALSIGAHLDSEQVPDFTRRKLYITRMEGHYYLLREKIIRYKKPPVGSEKCRNPLDTIWIRLHDSLSPYLDVVWAERTCNGYFFSIVEPFLDTAFKINDANAFLKKRVNAGLALKLTVHRIASSFFPLFCSRYGLDEISASYISGQDLRLFKSQQHYLYVDACQVCRRYLNTMDIVLHALNKNMMLERNTIAELKSKKKYQAVPFLSITDEEICSAQTVRLFMMGGAGYGSGIVPTTEDLKLYLTSLRNKIEALGMGDIVKRHNLFTVYAYFCAEFNFALRPRNNLPYLMDRFCLYDYEVINDKLSCRYYEDRLLPVSERTRNLCVSLRNGFPIVKKHIGAMSNPALLAEKADRLFSFITKRGKLREFTLTRAKKVLMDSGVPFPFNWKSARHFVRSYFYENDVADQYGDAWLGHHHISREPLGFASSLPYGDLKDVGLKVVDGMFDEIGITNIDYLPEEAKIG
jgi:hypothetical protein